MQTVVRALSVLRELSEGGGGLGLQELAERLGIPVASMHRLLAVLAEERFVARSPSDRRYYLGPAARALSAAHSTSGLRAVAQPRLTAASSELGQTMFLTELSGGRAICIAIAQGTRPLRLFVRLGQEMPLHAAAAARTLLAYRDRQEARELLAGHPLERYTDATPTGADEVLARLELVRHRGYDVCDDELDHDVWAVAAPVRGVDGVVCASITMAAPAGQLPEQASRDHARKVVLAAAADVSARLGYQAHDATPAEPIVSGLTVQHSASRAADVHRY